MTFKPLVVGALFFGGALVFGVFPPLGGLISLASLVYFFAGIFHEPEEVPAKRDAARKAERGAATRRAIRQSERRRQIASGEIPPDFRSYEEYMKSAWWAALRAHTLAYLRRTCEFCGAAAAQVHHVRYPKIFGTESIKSLFAVCNSCHEIAHGAVPAHPAGCAFCGDVTDHTLWLALSHTARRSHEVCRRCWCIGKGMRRQANLWSRDFYDRWVKNWSQSFKGPVPAEKGNAKSLTS